MRLFRSFTRLLTNPVTAWPMFLVLVTSNLICFWVLNEFFDIGSETIRLNIESHRQSMDSQAEIMAGVRKVLQVSGNCQ